MKLREWRVTLAKIVAILSIALLGFTTLLALTEIALYALLWINFKRLTEPVKFFINTVIRGVPPSLAIELTGIYKREVLAKYSIRNLIKLLTIGKGIRESVKRFRGQDLINTAEPYP